MTTTADSRRKEMRKYRLLYCDYRRWDQTRTVTVSIFIFPVSCSVVDPKEHLS